MDNISALTPDAPTQSHEHAVISPNGDVRWQRWINRAIFDGRGKVVEYQAIGEDISERMQAEAELKATKGLFELTA
jgi:two-component system cell cycle sensor histidine kinase/response regulator CckA